MYADNTTIVKMTSSLCHQRCSGASAVSTAVVISRPMSGFCSLMSILFVQLHMHWRTVSFFISSTWSFLHFIHMILAIHECVGMAWEAAAKAYLISIARRICVMYLYMYVHTYGSLMQELWLWLSFVFYHVSAYRYKKRTLRCPCSSFYVTNLCILW